MMMCMAGWERTRLSCDRKKAGEQLTSARAFSALETLLFLSSEPPVPTGEAPLLLLWLIPFSVQTGKKLPGKFQSVSTSPIVGGFSFSQESHCGLQTHLLWTVAAEFQVPAMPGRNWYLSKYSKYYKQSRGGNRGSERRSTELLAAAGSFYPMCPLTLRNLL